MSDGAETALPGGWSTNVKRLGDIVYRSPKPQSRTVIALLQHLHDRGFHAAPRPIGGGFALDGREQLTFIEGASPHPLAWTDEALFELGRLLRQLHRATADFVPSPDAIWQPTFARTLPGTRPVIGHGDLGPWNILARHNLPVAFLDWDTAGPVDLIWELAETAWLNVQLYDDDIAEMNQLPDVATRANQLAIFLDAYGLERSARVGFVDAMVEFAIRSARAEAIHYEVQPDTASPAPDGFPTLWAVTWRARSAAWMLYHKAMLERAILR